MFQGIAKTNISALLHCLGGTEKRYSKNTILLSLGDPVKALGIVLSGSVLIQKEDFWGNRSILTKVTTGGFFAEAFAALQIQESTVSVLSIEKTTVLWIPFAPITTPCQNACEVHRKLIENMLQLLAKKNILLTEKIQHTACRTTKEKLMSYLSAQAMKGKSNTFSIPFNRQELADYLAVDRSAMSKALCDLRDNGVLSFSKNTFVLHYES